MKIIVALFLVALLAAAAGAGPPLAARDSAPSPPIAAAPATPEYLHLGSPAADVLRLQGPPTAKRNLGDAEIWFHSQSQVYIRAGKVWHWLVVDRPLAFDGYPRPPRAARPSADGAQALLPGSPGRPAPLPHEQFQAMTQLQVSDFWRRQSALPSAPLPPALMSLRIVNRWKLAELLRGSVQDEVQRRSQEVANAWKAEENHRRVVEAELRRRERGAHSLSVF